MKKALLAVFVLVLICNIDAVAETFAAMALKIEKPPKIDGKLEEPFWQEAPLLGEFYLWKGENDQRVTDTEVRMAYDNAWLYMGVKCVNPLQSLILEPKTVEHNGPIHTDESIELFFDSTGDGTVYYHFLLSSFNIKAEQRVIKGLRERTTWNFPWRSATMITSNGWTAEIAIPLYLFLEYGDFDQISFNVARNRRMPFMDEQGVVTHEQMEASLCQPVVRSFHEPSSFGKLKPLTPDELRMPFMASLENVEIQPYFNHEGKNYYAVTTESRGANIQEGTLELVVTDEPAIGKPHVVRRRFQQAGTDITIKSLNIPAPNTVERIVRVELWDVDRDEVLRSVTVENPSALKVMDVYLDRNYYTTEEKALAVADIALPAESLQDMHIAVQIGEKMLTSAPAVAKATLPFSIENLPAGKHSITITLMQSNGTRFFGVDTELVKRVPNPGVEWKIDQINRVVLKPDGAPFFPVGLVMNGIQPTDDAAFKEIADAGCNTFFQWRKDVPAKDAVKYLEQARQHGLYVISLLEAGWRTPADSELSLTPKILSEDEMKALMGIRSVGTVGMKYFLLRRATVSFQEKTSVFREYVNQNLPVTEQVVQNIMHEPNLLAYSSFDEPYGAIFDFTQSLDVIYRLTHATDGYHPVKLLYSSYIPAGSEFVTCCDILCTDPYWTPAGQALRGVRGTPNFVSKIVHLNDQRAAEFRKAVWIVPVGSIWSGFRKRGLTAAEQDCQNFLAVIHGAKGLIWFSYPMDRPYFDILSESIAKVNVIGPMAVQPKVYQTINYLQRSGMENEYNEIIFDASRDIFPDVQGRLFRDPEGEELVLIVANSRYYPVKTTFTVEGLKKDHVQCAFLDNALPVTHSSFQEELEPFGVRAYRLGVKSATPAVLTMASTRPEKIPPPEIGLENNARAGRKNLFPNPAFDDTTIPGIPDYYYGSYGGFILDDSGTAKFGNNCIKLVNDSPGQNQIQWRCAPHHNQATPYVWSFWAKGENGGERLWVRHAASDVRDTITLTDTWQRYIIPKVMPPRVSERDSLFLIRLTTPGTIWIDGLQLEKGYEATEFEN